MHRESLTIPLPEATLTQMVRDLVRSSLHAWSWQAHVVPGEPGGAPDAWALSLRWLVIVGLVLLMSRWREGPDARIELTRREAA